MTSISAVLVEAEDLESRIAMSFLEKNLTSFIKAFHLSLFKPFDISNFSPVDFLATGRHESNCAFNSNLQARLAMHQSWIMLSMEVSGELAKPRRQHNLWEEMREDEFKRSPR
jgi:hypothetical protein